MINLGNDQFKPLSPKKEKSEDANVKAARNRFKSVLKHMVQDNSYMHDDDSDSDNDENRIMRVKMNRPASVVGRGLGLPSPAKKRTKSGSLIEGPKVQQASFVMKLFDRGVDLAQFDETTALYPICRAWMQNKPHAVRSRPSEQDNESETSEAEREREREEVEAEQGETAKQHNVYRLPPPDPLPMDEYGNMISIRVPPPLERNEEEFDINYEDDAAPSPALLFQSHLDRWNLIRQRWREASAFNERRYHSSFEQLRQIHDRVGSSAAITSSNYDMK